MKVAAILTCFNRRNKTMLCLESLLRIIPECDVFLTDDGCTDGTADAVRLMFPKVNIIKGTGNLYWSRGMYTAWKEALKGDYDYYLWLNDDIELYDNVIDDLFEAYNLFDGNSVVTGLVENQTKDKIIYGGSRKVGGIPQYTGKCEEVVNMNGNVVLVPRVIVESVGIIDPKLWHDLGDVDYGLMVQKYGYKVVTTRVPIAQGYVDRYCRIRKWGTNIIGRFKKLQSPLGAPLAISFYFRKKHYGVFNAFAFCSYLVFINILSDMLITCLFGDKYSNEAYNK